MTSIVDPGTAGGIIRSDCRGRVLVAAEQREALLDARQRGDLTGVGSILKKLPESRSRQRVPGGALTFARVKVPLP